MSTGTESTTFKKKEPLPPPTKVTSPPPTGSILPMKIDAFDAKPKTCTNSTFNNLEQNESTADKSLSITSKL